MQEQTAIKQERDDRLQNKKKGHGSEYRKKWREGGSKIAED